MSALTGRPWRLPALTLKESRRRASEFAKITIVHKKYCPRYCGRLLFGVTIQLELSHRRGFEQLMFFLEPVVDQGALVEIPLDGRLEAVSEIFPVPHVR